MSEPVTRTRWPAYLALLALTTAFAWVFLISIERAKSQHSVEQNLETGTRTENQNLQTTPDSNTLPSGSTPRQRLLQPAPWWPATLFGLAFLCGWLYRQEIWKPLRGDHPGLTASIDDREVQETPQRGRGNDAREAAQPSDPYVAVRSSSGPDLNTDFPWDDSLLDDTDGLTSEEHITHLERQNASKAEIIKALELLVTENREKWLHQDETEYRLNNHIQTLTDDLRVAVRQLQRMQSTSTISTDKPVEDPQSRD